ncbi:transcriptional coactivator PipX [Gloeocapsa sp. PCC 73106]|uniref:transcriptional coactivator PipX n=1 Tax=Gloeocapsa sp. PCC 73106 TaxID=102232 RepID=UPI0002ABD8F2|nr:PipX family protein [Gloeocapsa sp. PCC 73106]ELR97977.1 Protein of unknown function (DUF3539) [Gloeocapsa sp. PCC 73106]
MTSEIYLNHPTFGLLYRVCVLGDGRDLFTTLYAQRLFFIVTTKPEGVNFEPITRSEARLSVDRRLRELRMLDASAREYLELHEVYKRTF